MLTISDEQRRILAEPALLRWLEDKVTAFFPELAEAMDHDERHALIRAAHGRARTFGFGEEQILSYVGLEVLFGADFSRDPAHAWAFGILTDPTITDPAERARRLRTAAATLVAGE
jgi:hypothetical protein